MNKIKITQYAGLVKKSVRTLRLHALQGKINAKKIDGQWYVLVDDKKSSESEQNSKEESSHKNHSVKNKMTKVGELGTYKEMVTFLLVNRVVLSTNIAEVLESGIMNISWGFYSYDKREKVHFFKKARLDFVKALTLSHLESDENSNQGNKKVADILDNSIIAGISGLIKKHEAVNRNEQRAD